MTEPDDDTTADDDLDLVPDVSHIGSRGGFAGADPLADDDDEPTEQLARQTPLGQGGKNGG